MDALVCSTTSPRCVHVPAEGAYELYAGRVEHNVTFTRSTLFGLKSSPCYGCTCVTEAALHRRQLRSTTHEYDKGLLRVIMSYLSLKVQCYVEFMVRPFKKMYPKNVTYRSYFRKTSTEKALLIEQKSYRVPLRVLSLLEGS